MSSGLLVKLKVHISRQRCSLEGRVADSANAESRNSRMAFFVVALPNRPPSRGRHCIKGGEATQGNRAVA